VALQLVFTLSAWFVESGMASGNLSNTRQMATMFLPVDEASRCLREY